MIELPMPPRAREMLRENRGELLVVVLITIAALIPRVWDLIGVPPGLHGDEAWTGLRAADILHGKNVGPFDRIHGLGQPAGMEYLTAAFVKIFGSSTLTLRLPMALLGTATVPATYWLARESFNRTTAVIAALLLAFMGWHIHFSRIALPPVSWPFFEVMACGFFFLAMRSRAWWQFVLAGAFLGMGVYTYSSYSIFVVAFGVFVLYLFITQHIQNARQFALGVGVMFGVALIVALPMLEYIATNQDIYFRYPREISLFNDEQYKNADGPLGRADVIADAGRDFVQRVVFDPEPDYSDGVGSGPMLDAAFSVLLGLGALVAFFRWRQPGAALALLVLLVVPWAGILTVRGGVIRRALGVTPFLAILAALPAAELIRITSSRRPQLRNVAYAIAAVAVLTVAMFDLRGYFGTFPDSDVAQYVFVPELVAASNYLNDLPDEPRVYFFSDRWSYNYETRRYLAPKLQGEDRSREFGRYTFSADPASDAVFVFLGGYVSRIDDVKGQYPGGTEHEEKDGDTVLFRAYYVPRDKISEAPTPGPNATGTPGTSDSLEARQRDGARIAALAQLQDALEKYRSAHGGYPNSHDGAIQTFCVFPDADAGCLLREFLDPLPEDPLGNATDNGYFYKSDGKTYTVYARRDSSMFAECDESPAHLATLPGVLCVHGGG